MEKQNWKLIFILQSLGHFVIFMDFMEIIRLFYFVFTISWLVKSQNVKINFIPKSEVPRNLQK
jgi:hypothetical protein